MRKSRMMLISLLTAAAAMTGCQNRLKSEQALLKDENAALKAQLADRNAALESCHADLRTRDQQLAQLRREGDGPRGLASRTGFEGIEGVTGSVGAGEVTASVDSDLLFDPGKATLKQSAMKSLDKVAQVLNSTYASQRVRVGGHTDSDPIRKSGHKSNYHLGFERAFAVREYLVSKGVAANRIYLASYGPDAPKGSKAQSRRVEMVVVMN